MPFPSTEEFARVISLLTDAEKVLQLSILSARIKSSHLAHFTYHWGFFLFFILEISFLITGFVGFFIIIGKFSSIAYIGQCSKEYSKYDDYERKQQPATKSL